MSEDRKAKLDAIFADEPWAKLATEAGFRPWDTESSARDAFRHCAENMVHRDLADALAAALRGAIGALEFSRDYHADLGNEDQGFAQGQLDDALAALAAWEARK